MYYVKAIGSYLFEQDFGLRLVKKFEIYIYSYLYWYFGVVVFKSDIIFPTETDIG